MHGDAYYGIGRRLVHEGDVRDPELADLATGRLSDWLAGRQDEPAPAPAPGAVDYGELYWRMDVEGLRLLAALPDVASRAAGDGFAVRTGNLDNTLNGVVCDACSDDELADVLAWLGGRPAQWLVSERSRAAQQLIAAGARAELDSVVMGGAARGLHLHAGRRRTRCARPRASRSSTRGWASPRTGGWSTGRSRARAAAMLHGLALSPAPRVRLQIAWADDLAIGAISARRLDEILLIEHLGVRSGSQRSGVGRALIAAALRAEPEAAAGRPRPHSLQHRVLRTARVRVAAVPPEPNLLHAGAPGPDE